MSCEVSPDQSADDVAEASMQLAEAGGFSTEWRINTQNDFIWLAEERVRKGLLTPQEAMYAFRDYSSYLDACQAMNNGSSNAV